MSKKQIVGTALGIAAIVVIVAVVLVALFWKVPILRQLKNVTVPKNSTEVETEVIFSDVYWNYIIGERIIKCDEGFEAAKAYIEENNSEKALKHISVIPFFREWDDYAVSPYDYMETVDKTDRDKYVLINYYYEF